MAALIPKIKSHIQKHKTCLFYPCSHRLPISSSPTLAKITPPPSVPKTEFPLTSAKTSGGRAFTTTSPFQTPTVHGGRAFTTTSPFQTPTVHGGRAFTTTSPFQTPTVHGYLLRLPRPVSSFSRAFHYGDFPADTKEKSYENFYRKHLAHHLEEKIYPQMDEPNQFNPNSYFITISDFVDVVLRYPAKFEDDFWQEVVKKRIIVEDPMAKYPVWFKGGCPLKLKHPIQLITYSKPPRDGHIFYTDGSPNHNPQSPGGGGIVWIDEFGEMTLLGIRLPPNSPFVMEVTTQNHAARYGFARSCLNCKFITDSMDATDAKTGRAYYDDDYQELGRFSSLCTMGLEQVEYEFKPREAMALCDAIARHMKNIRKDKVGVIVKLTGNQIPEHIRELAKKMRGGAPVMRIEYFSEDEVINQSQPRKSPRFRESFYDFWPLILS